MKTKVTTIEEAQALPERSMFDMKIEVLPDGTTVRRHRKAKLSIMSMDEDAILIFTDKDGRAMKVNVDEDGLYKEEFRI